MTSTTRNDIRKTSRDLVVRDGDRIIADTQHPFVLYESGFAPRWYVPRTDIDDTALSPADHAPRRRPRTRRRRDPEPLRTAVSRRRVVGQVAGSPA